MNLKSILGAAAIAVGLLGAAQTGHAEIIVIDKASGTGENVMFNSCSAAVFSGPTVTGCLNGQPNTLINFTSTVNLLAVDTQVNGGGQARIEGLNGATYSSLTINSIIPATFSTLVLNIDATEAGQVQFTGTPGGTSILYDLKKGGQNFFTITGENFDFVSFQTFGASVNSLIVSDTAQIRLNTTVVPEPMSLALFGTGLLGLGLVRNRKSRDRVAG